MLCPPISLLAYSAILLPVRSALLMTSGFRFTYIYIGNRWIMFGGINVHDLESLSSVSWKFCQTGSMDASRAISTKASCRPPPTYVCHIGGENLTTDLALSSMGGHFDFLQVAVEQYLNELFWIDAL